MIVVKLLGGLGNQMFQYAIGRKLALMRNEELFLDCSFFDEKGTHTPREFELDIFNIKSTNATDEILSQFVSSEPNLIGRMVNRILGKKVEPKSYIEKGHAFQNNVFNLDGNIHLIGYWQTEKYFKDIEQELRKDFAFKYSANGKNAELLSKIESCNSISLHIRRGDYVSNNAANTFHGLCGLDYYKAGVDYIASRVNDIQLFIFSDDIAWAKVNLNHDFPMTFIDHNTGKSSWEDMRLMSQCKHNIIANSSFSWWAAWLNNHPDKMVVAPKQWFTDTTINTQDVIPDSWIKL